MENKLNNNQPIINFNVPQGGNLKYVFIGLACLVLIIAISFLIWFVPASITEITTNSEKIVDLTEKNGKLNNAVTILNATNKSELDQNLFLAESALPSEKRVTGLVSALTNLASSSGVAVDQIEISFGNVSTKSGTRKLAEVSPEFSDIKLSQDVVGVPIVMNIKAPDTELLQFVDKVQQALPLLDIRDITVSLAEDGQSGKVSVLVYSQTGEEFTNSKAGKISALTNEDLSALSTLSTKQRILQ